MKKILYTLLLFPIIAIGQTNSENFIRTKTYKSETSTSIPAPSLTEANQNITYFDGLGRPIQQIAHQQSGSGKDIVTPIEYDNFGRQEKEYLPYATTSSSLNYVISALDDVGNFPQYVGQNPYSKKLLEASPLSRVLKQAAPGNDWSMANNHVVQIDYQTNTVSDAVKLFTVTSTWSTSYELYDIPTTLTPENYAEFQLYKTITKDENWVTADGNKNTTEEFKDKEGKVVLKRTYNVIGGVTEKHDTYYVYDQFGNLTFVLPPLVNATANITQTVLDGLCYQYKYDNRNRLAEKKLPGKQWEFIIYDKLDRIVATGPAFSPFMDASVNTFGWLFTKYDTFNRVVYTGWMSANVTSATRKTLQADRNSATNNFSETKISTASNTTVNGVNFRYSNVAFPTSGYHVLKVNYYDDYNFPNAPTSFPDVEGEPVFYNNTYKPKGLQTGSFVRVLEQATDIKAENSYTFYDSKARPIRNHTKNYLGGFTQIDTKLDWFGRVLKTVTTHKRVDIDSPIKITETFEYTQQDLLYKHKHQINDEQEETLSENFYDDLGKHITKNTGTNLQEVNYTYNIRGWLTSINDNETAHAENGYVQLGSGDLFAFKISYNDLLFSYPSTENVKKLYNGNISETQWITSTDNITRHYGYQYDNLNRLENSFFKKPNVGDEENAFNENLQYDKNGNIIRLERNGKIYSDVMPIDLLTYDYNDNSNTLKSVNDDTVSPQGFNDGNLSSTDYSYDTNGNMVSDKNKGIDQIFYNHLNLPMKIKFFNGNQIDYLYNALGQKLGKIVRTGSEHSDTEYLSGFQYRASYTQAVGNSGPKELQYFPTSEGYVLHKEQRFFYIYNYTDHLGNIRLSYTLDHDTNMIKIMEENHYYPFGLKHDSYNTQHLGYTTFTNEDEIRQFVLSEVPKFVGDGSYNYKFQGQERQDELGLNWDSFKYRNYDPAIGRFMNIDPLTEDYVDWGPYVFSGNRVIDSRELEGLEPHSTHKDFQEASRNFSQQYNGYSIENKVEVATQYYKCPDGTYSYATPVEGAEAGVDYTKANDIPSDAVLVGFDHTHSNENDTSTVQFSDKVTNRNVDKKSVTLSNIDDFNIISNSNKPSDDDLQRAEEASQNMGNSFEGAHVFTPSGLAYTIKVVGGKAESNVNKNLSKTNPSQKDAAKRFNNVPTDTKPVDKPIQLPNVYGIKD